MVAKLHYRGGGQPVSGRTPLRVVAGCGCIGNTINAKAYRGVPIRIPITDTIKDTGEAMSSTATWGNAIVLSFWLRARTPGSHALTMLSRKSPFAWRFLPDGTLWFGDETWPEVEIDHELMSEMPASDAVEIATDDLLLPGTTFLGRRVARVNARPHESRTTAWFERT